MAHEVLNVLFSYPFFLFSFDNFFSLGVVKSVIFHLFVWDRINEKVISLSPRMANTRQFPILDFFQGVGVGCGVTEGLNCSSIFYKIDVACNHSLKEGAFVRQSSEHFPDKKIPGKKREKGWTWAGVALPNIQLNLRKPQESRDNIENSVPPMQSIQTELLATVGLFAFFIPKQATQF